MACDEIHLQLDAYRNVEIPYPDAGRISAHLENCAECRQVLEELRTVSESLRNWAPVRPHPDHFVLLTSRIRAVSPTKWILPPDATGVFVPIPTSPPAGFSTSGYMIDRLPACDA